MQSMLLAQEEALPLVSKDERGGIEFNVGIGAQADIPVGSYGRVLRQFYNGSDTTSVKVLPKPGFRAGVTFGYDFGNDFYIGSGLYLNHRGWWEFYRFDETDTLGRVIGNQQLDFRHVLFQLDVPVEIRYQPAPKFRVLAGFHLNMTLDARINVREDLTLGGTTQSSAGSISFQDAFLVPERALNYTGTWALQFGDFQGLYAGLYFQYSGNLVQEDVQLIGGQAFQLSYDLRFFSVGLELGYNLFRQNSRPQSRQDREKGDKDDIRIF